MVAGSGVQSVFEVASLTKSKVQKRPLAGVRLIAQLNQETCFDWKTNRKKRERVSSLLLEQHNLGIFSGCEMEPPRDGNGDDSDGDRDIENGRSKGGPPPPPPPGPASHAPSSSKAAASPMKLKATDHVKFEDLRSTRAGENLYYGKKAAWRGPISHTKGDWKVYSPGAHSAAKSTPPATLKVVTYNVLFAEECMGDRRVATELALLQEANADIITIVEGSCSC